MPRFFSRVCFIALTGFCLFRAGASVTIDKPDPPDPPVPVSEMPQMWQIEYDVETGKPTKLIGAAGLTDPTGPIFTGYNSTNAVMSVEMQGLIDFLEGLQDE